MFPNMGLLTPTPGPNAGPNKKQSMGSNNRPNKKPNKGPALHNKMKLVRDQVWYLIRTQVWYQIRFQIQYQVYQIWGQVGDQVCSHIQDQLDTTK